MQWFKHQADARHDPFIWDLRQRFGGEGYFVYFATLEIYADSYKPAAGWFLDISIDYLKHELGIYHTKKLINIMDFIRSWPNVDGVENRPPLPGEARGDLAPKWIAQLSKSRAAILIPTFTRIMDEYSRKLSRKADEPAPRPAFSNGDGKVAVYFRDIARDCEILAGLPPIDGRRFPAGDFVGWCVNQRFHPGAIRDCTAALVKQVEHWGEIKDPWAYARGVVRTRAGFYNGDPVDHKIIQTIFGGFFNGRDGKGRKEHATSRGKNSSCADDHQ